MVLRGADSYFDRDRNRRVTFWPRLLHHRVRGVAPGVSAAEVDASLARLVDARVVVAAEQGRWRLRRHVEAEAARTATRIGTPP